MPKNDDFLEGLLKKQASSARTCAVGRFLSSDDVAAEVREGISRALEVKRIYAGTIAAVMQEHGFDVSEKPVQRHRSHKCSCFKVEA